MSVNHSDNQRKATNTMLQRSQKNARETASKAMQLFRDSVPAFIDETKKRNTGTQSAANSLPPDDWNDCHIVMLKFMCRDFCCGLWWRRFCTFPVVVSAR